MSRKRVGVKREIKPDPKYNSVLAAKFINNLMSKGKKKYGFRRFFMRPLAL